MAATFTASVLAVTVGFAAGPRGGGVAYASISEADALEGSLVRVGFRCRPLPALCGRDIAYAALEAVAAAVRSRGVASVIVRIDNAALVADIVDHRPVPAALTVPYVRLGCTLNRFRTATLVAAADPLTRDLTARAGAEASFDVAA